jgi:hypothetical protein
MPVNMMLGLPLRVNAFETSTLFGPTASAKQGVYEESETQNFALGTKWVYGDGRTFRYAKNGAVALGKALMTQTQVVETKLIEIAQTAHTQVVGAEDVTLLVTTASAVVGDSLVGGTLWFNKVSNMGESYRIIASALRPGTDTLLDLKLETPIRAAVLAASEASVCPNPWYKVVVFPTTTTGSATGVPLIAVTAGYFFWAQTGGDCPIYVDTGETAVIGNLAGPPAGYTVPGAAGVWVTVKQLWGTWRTVNAADEVGLVDLWLDR